MLFYMVFELHDFGKCFCLVLGSDMDICPNTFNLEVVTFETEFRMGIFAGPYKTRAGGKLNARVGGYASAEATKWNFVCVETPRSTIVGLDWID